MNSSFVVGNETSWRGVVVSEIVTPAGVHGPGKRLAVALGAVVDRGVVSGFVNKEKVRDGGAVRFNEKCVHVMDGADGRCGEVGGFRESGAVGFCLEAMLAWPEDVLSELGILWHDIDVLNRAPAKGSEF